jgi:hypothetical protein
MAVSKRLRYEVLRRDGHTCKYCGAAAPDVKLTVDHVIPVALGGTNEPTNLVAACVACNVGKSASNPDAPLIADVDERAAKWAQAMQIAIERRTAELAQDRDSTAAFDAEWTRWSTGDHEVPRDPNWRESVLRFLGAGVDPQFLVDAVGIAMRNQRIKGPDTWRYFCGVCWREVEKIQQVAGEIARQDDAVRHPSGQGLHPDFEILDLAAAYVSDLVEISGLPAECVTPASRAFWDGMEWAYKEFLKTHLDGHPDACEDDCSVSRAMFAGAAYELANVWDLCGRPGEDAVVPDGAE